MKAGWLVHYANGGFDYVKNERSLRGKIGQSNKIIRVLKRDQEHARKYDYLSHLTGKPSLWQSRKVITKIALCVIHESEDVTDQHKLERP